MKNNKFATTIYVSEVVLFIYIIIFKIFLLNSFLKYIDIFNILVMSILVLFCYKLLGLPKKDNLINYRGFQSLIINFILYYVIIYIFGLFLGFLRNGYSLNLINIAKNVSVALVFYAVKELYRYIIARKSKSKKMLPLIIVTILLALLDIIMEMNSYDLKTGMGIFEFIEVSVIPNFAKSILLSYISYYFNYKLVFLFLGLYDLPTYFLPIIPDLGNYVNSMIKLIFLFICYYSLSLLLEKYERKVTFKDRNKKKYLFVPFLTAVIILVGLVSGLFKYHLFAIGSNSMLPYFQRGDAVLIKKLKDKELSEIELQDVIAFYHNNQIIVHRVVSIEENNGNYKIWTKGDNNDSIDAWIITNKDIYGKVENVINYIGLPSVELSELMSKEW
jgi:signal peptidase I